MVISVAMYVCLRVLVLQVTVPPGPLGVVLDGEVGDRPVVLEVQGVSPYSTLPVTAMPERGVKAPCTIIHRSCARYEI